MHSAPINKLTGSGQGLGPADLTIMMNQMKLKHVALLAIGLLPLGAIAQTNKPQTPPPSSNFHVSGAPGQMAPRPMSATPPMPEKGKLSYAIGMYFGNNITNSIKRGELTVDTNDILAAITDVLDGKKTRMSETEVRQVLEQLKAAMAPRMKAMREEQMKEREAQMEKAGAENKAKGDAFMAQFAKAAGVTTLPDGMEYKVIKDGTGAKPKEDDTVTVNYRGTLIDGTEFDRHDGFTHSLKGGIITGWRQILPLMKVGSKWQVAIPAALAYGTRGSPPKIPGNSVLIFDLELTSITPGAPNLQTAPPSPSSATPAAPSTPVVSGEIIKVPSADELKKGAKIEVIKSGQTNVVNNQ